MRKKLFGSSSTCGLQFKAGVKITPIVILLIPLVSPSKFILLFFMKSILTLFFWVYVQSTAFCPFEDILARVCICSLVQTYNGDRQIISIMDSTICDSVWSNFLSTVVTTIATATAIAHLLVVYLWKCILSRCITIPTVAYMILMLSIFIKANVFHGERRRNHFTWLLR